jgi:predicted nicotinamide N-methyase
MQNDSCQEDDWSSLIQDDSSSYVNHDLRRVQVARADADADANNSGGNKFLTVACVTHLSPLDMMDLSWGAQDATGNRVWMGALLFIESLQSLKPYLESRRVLELGCGTGIAGLAVAQVFRPQRIILTDNSEAVLDLCRRNILLNTTTTTTTTTNDKDDDDVEVEICKLEWGGVGVVGQATSSTSTGGYNWKESSVDTVLATDVLYDLGSLLPLLTTASGLLVTGGYFILSHVPRASLPSPSCTGSGRGGCSSSFDNLEAYIVHQAKDFGLELDSILQPNDLPQSQLITNDLSSLKEMHDTGAAVLIFIKQ